MSLDQKKYKSYKKWLFHYLSKQKSLVVCVFIGITIVTLTRTLVPLLIGDIIDNAFISRDNAKLIRMLLLTFALYTIRNGMDYGTMMMGHYLGLKTEQNMRQEFFETIQLKPLRYHDTAKTGDLEALATNDVRIVNTMISHGAFFFTLYFKWE